MDFCSFLSILFRFCKLLSIFVNNRPFSSFLMYYFFRFWSIISNCKSFCLSCRYLQYLTIFSGHGSPPSRFSNLCRRCCCGSSDSGISRNKIEPVIFQPLNDIYLQLKPHRRLRVIHINGQIGAMPTHSPYYLLPSG